MVNLKGVEIAFFDIDGVLSIPRYDDGYGYIRCSISDDEAWFQKVNWSEDCYKLCKANPKAIELLEELTKKNVRLFALTHETNSGSYFNKVNFVLNNYSKYFKSYRQVLFVDNQIRKIDLMDVICSKYAIKKKNCLLIEDSFDVCMKASSLYYRVCHISELFLSGGE